MKRENIEAIIVGSFAGTIPVLLNLLNIEVTTILKEFDWLTFCGYAIRVILLMVLSGFLVYVNSEVDKRKALQIGIMAPAILIGYINGENLDDTKKQLNYAQEQIQQLSDYDKNDKNVKYYKEPSFRDRSVFSFIPSAYADNDSVLKGRHRDPGSWDRLWYGLTGKIKKGWFVISGSHKSKEAAQQQARKLEKMGYKAMVFPPFGSNQYYGVIIGSYINFDEAKTLRDQAIKDGLPKDTYLWKYKP
ncbi:SPOR domain-containing protein [Candidatus Magnetomoraceae bacterium gMMP-15]